jgi:DNA polymerase V
VPKPEAVVPAKAAIAANPEQANLFAASSYSPILRQMGVKRLTEGPEWKEVSKLDAKGNTISGVINVKADNPESTFRAIGVSKPAISPAEAARLNWEGIPYGGGGGGSNYTMPAGNAPQIAPQGGTRPVIRPAGNQVSIATNAPSYAQNAVTMPSAGTNANVPLVSSVNVAGLSPKARQEFLTEQAKELVDINGYLIRNEIATYIFRVKGNSMIDAGIFDGDVLIVDRSIEPKHNDIVLVTLHNEFIVKRLFKRAGVVKLVSENPIYPPIVIKVNDDFAVWGVVTNSIQKLC